MGDSIQVHSQLRVCRIDPSKSHCSQSSGTVDALARRVLVNVQWLFPAYLSRFRRNQLKPCEGWGIDINSKAGRPPPG